MLQVHDVLEIPAETARIARLAFPKGSLALALVTVLQFAEGLPDRQAADAVRGRIDWKYALGLELSDPGFDSQGVCDPHRGEQSRACAPTTPVTDRLGAKGRPDRQPAHKC